MDAASLVALPPGIRAALESHAGAPLIAAWSAHPGSDTRWLGLYSVAHEKLQLLDEAQVDEHERADATTALEAHAVVVGTRDPANERVWVAEPGTFAVWSSSRCEARMTRDRLWSAGEGAVDLDAVEAVEAFAGDGHGCRGVRLALADGATVVITEEDDPAALDPGNHAGEPGGAWARLLGSALAAWIGVPCRTDCA